MNNQDIASKIEDLEQQLKELRLKIETNTVKENSGTIQEGDRVDILNPRKGQEREWIVQKINTLTGYASVRTEEKKRIVRKIKI